MRRPTCRICPDDHACVEAYHEASASLRRWLRERLRLALEPVAPGKPCRVQMPVQCIGLVAKREEGQIRVKG